MAKEILISSTPHETRLAIVEDEQLTEVYYERENEYTLAGSIYKGKVTRVLPGMQSAFVDLGLERDAFLYVTDFLEEQEDSDEYTDVQQSGGRKERGRRGGDRPQERAERPAPAREPASSAAAEAEGEPSEEGGKGQEDFEQGTRRWRGRRGRRRGVRGARGPEDGAATGDGEELSSISIEAEATEEDVTERGEEKHDESRHGGRREQKTITLPGEALQKYGQQPVVAERAPAVATAEPAARSAQVTVRPSTLVEHPIAWDGVSAALPGETLSRHRERPTVPTAESTEHAAEEQQEIVSGQEGHALDASLPPVQEEPVPLVLEEEENNSNAQDAEFEPGNASASYRVDPSSPSEFRLSSLFGRDQDPSEKAVTPVDTADPEPQHMQHAHPADVPDASPLHEQADAADAPGAHTELHGEASHEAAALDHLHAFTPGVGQVEEEVIDDEEYDFAPLPEHAAAHDDEHDLSDLVEEETQVAGGSEIGDVIRDAQIDRQVISSDDDEFAEDEEEEEQPATAAKVEEEAPAPRRGRTERQRGRERRGRGRNARRQSAQTSELPIISELLKQGQEILVQIAKEPIAKKGARITSHIALPGRFLVFMPTVNHVGVSRKIWSDEERQRLKRILISEKGEASGGFIVRTAAENASEDELRADLRFLISLWNEIKLRSESAKAPALIYHDLNLVERILRDQVSDSFSTIWVDSESEYERIVRFLNRFQPSLVRRVKLYTKETPLYEQFGIQDEISKALKSKVWLKSGGSIVINQTEALVAIDINTGKYVGKTARLEDTILKTNLDAIPEIVRQIRLRDLGGIIVIDFIDMDERKNRHKVMAALEEELKSDRAPSKVLQFNDFGLVAITRKRVKQSLERTLSVQCNICSGTGMVKSPTTVANEIYIEMRKMQKHLERHDVMLRVHPEVVKALKGNNARWLNELEEMTGRTIIVKSDPALHPEQFDIH